MLKLGVSITGIPENIERMKNISLGLQPHEIGEIINYVCNIVRGEIQALAPMRTGRLRDSIINYMNTETSGEVAATAPYAMAVEYGYTSKGGTKVPGANFFRPPAIKGGKLLKDELLKYTIALTQGLKVKAPRAPRGTGGRGSIRAHKYLYVVETGAGKRYVYGKKSQTRTSFRPLLKPGPRKQPKSMFRAFRGGARRR